MPNRIIRDGWTESEAIDGLSPECERFFLRLLLKADDFARFHANPQLIRASLFPLKDSIRNTDISRWVAECEKAGLVRCYESTGKRFIWIAKFNQRTRAETSKFPPPPWQCPTPDGQMPDTRQTAAHGDGDGDGDVCVDGKSPRTPKRLHGIPNSVEEVIAYGKTCLPKPVSEERCRAFWAHYEGQAKTNPSGDVFWVTSGFDNGGGAIVTKWKDKLQSFEGRVMGNGGTRTDAKAEIDALKEQIKLMAEGPEREKMRQRYNDMKRRLGL